MVYGWSALEFWLLLICAAFMGAVGGAAACALWG